ncbi:hypothetical protein LUZ60_014857 [Juncus effusus]|nr:hypothetical protein LUZ60_014857 [Juncus effusus]
MELVTQTATTTVIEKLVDTVLNYASLSWWPSARSVRAEAEKLQAMLPHIRAVLAAIHGDQIKQRNPNFDARLWQFRDAIEAADDVLDEIEYYELEEKIKARNNTVSGSLSGCKRKLVDIVKHVFINDGILNKLRDVVKGLEAIAFNMGPYLQLANNLTQQLSVNNFRETGSFFIENMVVGREKEKEIIVEWLTTLKGPKDMDDQGFLSVFSIIGMGGMRKTTLAQLACKDQRVIENFDLILWVCMSDNFGTIDAKTMIKKIIEDIIKQACNLNSLNTLQNALKQHVASKKFLLVLDDVWSDDTILEWEKVVAPLRFGEKGCRILLTTRMDSVAKMIGGVMEGENNYLNLGGLAEKDFMTLFYMHAFAGTNPNKHHHIHEIGNKIARKLRACPLAAKVIGGVLNKCIDFEFWNKILNEDIINIEASKDYIMEILKLSYYHLPIYLQLCFRYCTIFPQNYKFEKAKLVKMWMGSGLIPPYVHNGRRPEDVGHEYLDQLTRKSFFNEALDIDTNMSCYFIHDLLYDLARCVSEGECLRITGDVTISISRTVRHLYIETKSNSLLKEIHNLNKLQTLIVTCIDPNFDEERELNDILSKLKSLRLLILTIGKEHKIPSTIGDLIHLRYLSVSCKIDHTSGEQVLRSLNSLYKLYHLEVIEGILGSTLSCDEMEGMRNLINLRYIHLPSFVLCNIPCIGRLSNLQELDSFAVKNKNGFKIGELEYLTNLRKLDIHDLKNISNPSEALEAKMDRKVNLKSLQLNWSHDPSVISDMDEKIADNLKPHANLNELAIVKYSGVRSPCWMNDRLYSNLTTVTLSGCCKLEHLPPLGQLNSLKNLRLYNLNAVKHIGNSLYGNSGACIFPSLKQLTFYGMPEWEEWIGVEDKLFVPCLEELGIKECPKLKRLPELPASLKMLTINGSTLIHFPDCVPLTSSLSYLEVTW